MRRWRTKRLARLSLAATLAVAIAVTALASAGDLRAEPPRAAPADFTAQGLARIRDYFQREVATGRIPGAVVLVQQHGKPLLFECFGQRDVVARRPMRADSIFRLYSMSKPITSVAAMMLVEDGKLALDDPLAKFVPDFADVRVAAARQGEGSNLATQPLQRPITILDLLRQTSGITYGFYGQGVVRKLYATSGLFGGDFDNATFVQRLARLPLAEQPGTLWDYGHSTDVLGRVIEIVSGQSLFAFEKARLLDPLGMRDTAFVADPAQRERVAAPLPTDRFDRPVAGIVDPVLPRKWQSGGAGMVGTAGDYARFAQMLLSGGVLDGRRYLRPATVAMMTSDQIGPGSGIARDPSYDFVGENSGFGLGFAVRTHAHPPFPAGEYRWDGVGGTFFFVDPADDMFTVVMMQSPSQRGRIETEVKKLIYEALGR